MRANLGVDINLFQYLDGLYKFLGRFSRRGEANKQRVNLNLNFRLDSSLRS
jgi:hypothetical protein